MDIYGVFILVFILLHTVESVRIDWHFLGANIAFGRPTSQGPGTTAGGISSRAVDGGTNPVYNSGTCTLTSKGTDGAYWNVTFDKDYNISGIRMYNRKQENILCYIAVVAKGQVNVLSVGERDILSWRPVFEFRYEPERWKDFNVFGIDESGMKSLIYNDSLYNQYRNTNWTITIEVNGQNSYTGVEIRIYSNNYLSICEVEVYAVKCEALLIPENAFVENDTLYYAENTSVQVRCFEGYEIHENYKFSFCGVNGWNRPYPSCHIITCKLPNTPDNGYYTNRDGSDINNTPTLNYNEVIVGQCNFGYQSSNNENRRVCQSDKTWNGTALVCKAKTCHLPGTFANGKYVIANSSRLGVNEVISGNTIEVQCNKGYILDRDIDTTRLCNLNGTWTGKDPVCNALTCEYPGDIPNGYYTILHDSDTSLINMETYTHGNLGYLNTIQASCNIGNYLKSGDKVRTCLETGHWSGETPVCDIIMCEWPLQLEDGTYKTSHDLTAKGLPVNTRLTAICDELFNLSDPGLQWRCNETGIWEGSHAVCEPICFSPSIDNGHIVDVLQERHSPGTILTFTCNTGYMTADNVENFTCLENHEWSPKPTCIEDSREEKVKSNNVQIGVGVSASLLVVLITGVLLFLYFTRRLDACREGFFKHARFGNDDIMLDNRDRVIPDKKAEDDPVYETVVCDDSADSPDYNVIGTHESGEIYNVISETKNDAPVTAINVQNLGQYILSKGAIETLSAQFEGLPMGMKQTHSIALKPHNIGKNRYKNMYAYDVSRVVLDNDAGEESDYINACYIDGFTRPKQYIASQGPTSEILVDFWRMIWQRDSKTIVMLTSLVEQTKVKCVQYWPDDGTHIYDNISVTLSEIEENSSFVIRTFTVQQDQCKKRKVKQYHFTAWPDKDVPKYPSTLLLFLHKVNESDPGEHMVVHCSAGVGRTGTFIALDYLSKQGRALGNVDIVGTLVAMRTQRVNFVQTLDQYIFLHLCLAESLMSSTKIVPLSEFQYHYESLLQIDKATGKSTLALEFETLQQMVLVKEEARSSKRISGQEQRLTNQRSIGEESSMDLQHTTSSRNCKGTVFLPSYKRRTGFIATHSPEQGDMSELWNLAWYNDVKTIVYLNNMEDKKKNGKYLSKQGPTFENGSFKVTTISSEDKSGYCVETFSLHNKDKAREIKQFEIEWSKNIKTVQDSLPAIVSLIELIQSLQQQSGNNAILVHCNNGVTGCGLFCVVYSILEQIKTDNEVEIVYVIDTLRSVCEQIIPNLEQYQFCHEIVLCYLEQYDTYSNFLVQ